MSREPCRPCIRQQSYYVHLLASTKVKAQNEKRSYAIWFDAEDRKYRAKPYAESKDYESESEYQIVSQYS